MSMQLGTWGHTRMRGDTHASNNKPYCTKHAIEHATGHVGAHTHAHAQAHACKHPRLYKAHAHAPKTHAQATESCSAPSMLLGMQLGI
jgi:hypothetical protein